MTFLYKERPCLSPGTKDRPHRSEKKVEALGGTAVSASLIAFQEALPDECADSLREDLSEPGWLVFTSVNGVRFFFSYLDRHGLALSGRKKNRSRR